MGKVYQLMQTGRGIVPGLVCGCVIEIEKNLVSSEYNFCSPFFKTYPEPIGFPRIVGVYATTTKLTLLSRRQTIQRFRPGPVPRTGPVRSGRTGLAWVTPPGQGQTRGRTRGRTGPEAGPDPRPGPDRTRGRGRTPLSKSRYLQGGILRGLKKTHFIMVK
jgi:hypothetical protein